MEKPPSFHFFHQFFVYSTIAFSFNSPTSLFTKSFPLDAIHPWKPSILLYFSPLYTALFPLNTILLSKVPRGAVQVPVAGPSLANSPSVFNQTHFLASLRVKNNTSRYSVHVGFFLSPLLLFHQLIYFLFLFLFLFRHQVDNLGDSF